MCNSTSFWRSYEVPLRILHRSDLLVRSQYSSDVDAPKLGRYDQKNALAVFSSHNRSCVQISSAPKKLSTVSNWVASSCSLTKSFTNEHHVSFLSFSSLPLSDLIVSSIIGC